MTKFEAAEIVALAKRIEVALPTCETGPNDDPEAFTTAHAIADISESIERLQAVIDFLMIRESRSSEELKDALLDMGEELRHIMYHARDAKFFAYLFES